jgi:hypothetical protein
MMQNAVLSTARILGAGYLANAAASSTATTSQDACRQYGMVTTVLRQEMQLARFFCDDALYMALHTFLVDAQRVLLSRVFDSPLVVEYNFNAGVFSVVAAHQIYGDAKRFAEIEARNIAALPFHIGPMVAAVQA